MVTPRNVVVPTDFSIFSETAFQKAVDIAASYKSKLHIIHVTVDETDHIPFIVISSRKAKAMMRQVKENAEFELNRLISKYIDKAEIEYEIHLEEGIPYEEILKLAEKVSADMIVIAPGEKSPIEGIFFGSTTDKVVHKATCNVLVTKQ